MDQRGGTDWGEAGHKLMAAGVTQERAAKALNCRKGYETRTTD